MAFRLAGTGRILLHIYVPSVLMGLALGMLVPSLPVLARSFGVAPELAAQAVTALLLGRVASYFPAGVIVDRLGRRAAMVIGPVIVTVGVLITAVTPWFGLIFVGQALVGSGQGIWSLGREIAAVEEIRTESRGRVIGAFFGIAAVGTAIGPVLGGRLADLAGYSAVFALAGVFTTIVFAIGLSYHDRPNRVRRATSGGVSLRRPFAAVAPGFVRTFQVVLFASFCAFLRETTVQSLLPVYVISYLGYSASDTGYLFGIVGMVQLLMIAPAGYISDKIGRKGAVVPAAALAGTAFVGFYLSTATSGLVVSAALLGVAAGLATGSMTAFTYDIVAPESRGMAQALRRSISESGSFLGPLVGGLIASATYPGAAFLALAPLHFLSALLVGLFARESLGYKVPVPAASPDSLSLTPALSRRSGSGRVPGSAGVGERPAPR
jgi:MFS family permease